MGVLRECGHGAEVLVDVEHGGVQQCVDVVEALEPRLQAPAALRLQLTQLLVGQCRQGGGRRGHGGHCGRERHRHESRLGRYAHLPIRYYILERQFDMYWDSTICIGILSIVEIKSKMYMTKKPFGLKKHHHLLQTCSPKGSGGGGGSHGVVGKGGGAKGKAKPGFGGPGGAAAGSVVVGGDQLEPEEPKQHNSQF